MITNFMYRILHTFCKHFIFSFHILHHKLVSLQRHWRP